MTTVYTGELVDILDKSSWDQIIVEGDLLNDEGKKDLTLLRHRWNQVTLQPQTKLIVDPSGDAWHVSLSPKKRVDLAFTGAVPKAWATWIKRYKLETTAIAPPADAWIEAQLTRGVKHLKFAPSAVEWFLRPFRKKEAIYSRREVNHRMAQLMLAYPTEQQLTAYDVDRVLGSAHRHEASRVVDALGTEEAVRLVCQIDDSEAIPLMEYLTAVLKAKNNHQLLALRTLRYGADQLKYDYKTAMVMFTLCCLQTSTLPKTKSASSVVTDRILGLYRISGIPC